jgi:hypothetical protein
MNLSSVSDLRHTLIVFSRGYIVIIKLYRFKGLGQYFADIYVVDYSNSKLTPDKFTFLVITCIIKFTTKKN